MDREKPLVFPSEGTKTLLDKVLLADDKLEFVSLVKEVLDSDLPESTKLLVRPSQLWGEFCLTDSVNCAAALINGETGQTVDLNVPSVAGFFPLHYAAITARPDLTELFLYHGARTDVRSRHHKPEYNLRLPLHLAVENLCLSDQVSEWNPKLSIFKLLFILCLPNMQNALETIDLLARNTSGVEEEILYYARNGKLVELTALLIVARKQLPNFATIVGECMSKQIHLLTMHMSSRLMYQIHYKFPSVVFKDMTETLMSGQQLIHVFEKAGDAIEAYIKEDKTNVSNSQSLADVKTLLQKAGFVLKPGDNLSDEKWFRSHMDSTCRSLTEGVTPVDWMHSPKDLGMLHYSSSSCRWPCKASSSNGLVRSFHTQRVFSKGSPGIKFPSALEAEVKSIVKGVEFYVPNVCCCKPWASVASVIKRGLRYI